MSTFFARIRQRFSPVTPLPESMHHFQAAPEDAPPYRLHLRLRKDGTAVLVVNAATILHLNPTAAEYAYHMVKGTPPERAAREISSRYRINRRIALQDYQDFMDRVHTLIDTPDLDPVTFLDFERVAPNTTALTAPLRLDCALTYRLPRGTKADDAPTKRVDRELDTVEWQTIIDKAWQVGVPHVIFTGGEPTLRNDLPDLIAHAEKNGQVAGLLSDGLKFTDKKYLDLLLNTGLDHLMLVLQPENELSWTSLKNVMAADLFVTVHLTVTPKNIKKVPGVLERLAGMQVRSLSMSTSDASLQEKLHVLRDKAADLQISLTWNLPVPYSALNPVTLETAEDNIPSGAGKAWLYIEPDGDVLPAQGVSDQVLGNILRDPWENIYHS